MPRMSPFLCLRRGVSRLVDGAPVSGCFSLPTQRCFHWSGNSRAPDGAFLCLRRGVSRPGAFPSGRIGFSLPTQRCFCRRIQCRHCRGLFSAYAEVFLGDAAITNAKIPFLCLRRGVSELIGVGVVSSPFSLPTQRCFQLAGRVGSLGVSFLCLRRGVSGFLNR